MNAASSATWRDVRSDAAKAAAVARVLFRRQWGGWPSLLVRAGFLVVLLTVFSRVWASALEGASASGISPGDAVWYIAITEAILLSVPLVHLEVESDVASGAVDTRMSRPMSYLAGRWAEGAASFAARAIVNGTVAAGFAFLLAGSGPRLGPGLAVVPLAIPLAGVCCVVWYSLVGMTAFWLRETSPAFWVFQKGLMLFGGLLMPIAIYPEWLQKTGAWLPFGDVLGGVGQAAFGAGPGAMACVCARIALWTIVGALLAAAAFRRGVARAQEGA